MAMLLRDAKRREQIAPPHPRRRTLEAAALQRPLPVPRAWRASLGHPDLVRRAQPCRCDPPRDGFLGNTTRPYNGRIE